MKKILAAAIAVSLTFSALAVPAAAWDELIPTSSEESFEEVSLDSAEDAVTDLDSSSEESTDSAADTDGEYSAVTDLDSATDAEPEAEADPQTADESAADITVMGKQSKEYDNITYTVLKDGTLRIDEFIPDEKAEEVTIPAEIDGKKVTKIGDGAFQPTIRISKLIISEGITHIGDENFCDMWALSEVNLPESLLKIGKSCFSYCNKLKTIKLPSKLKIIDSNCFYSTALKEVTIPASVTNLGDSESYMSQFRESYKLKYINVESGNKKYASNDGIVYNKAKTKLLLCPAGRVSVNVPNGVKEIGSDAFNSTNVKKIKLPSSVKKLDNACFRYAFCLESINIPKGVKKIPEQAFHGCLKLKNVTIPEGVTKLEGDAFYYLNELTNVTLPKSLTNIDEYTFGATPKLEKIYYAGSKAQWKKITNKDEYNGLTIKYNWKNNSKKLSDATLSLYDYELGYKGTAVKPKVKVNMGSKVLKNGTDYTVKYSNNNQLGTGTVTVTGKGAYSGTLKKKFKIVVNRPNITKIDFPDNEEGCIVNWTKDDYVDGYQLKYTSDRGLTGGKKITINGKSNTSCKLDTLTKGKTYYVLVRSFKKVNGKIKYSAWSSFHSVQMYKD